MSDVQAAPANRDLGPCLSDPVALQAHWDRIDARNCRKGRHEANRPVWSGLHGGIAGWRCYCAALLDKEGVGDG